MRYSEIILSNRNVIPYISSAYYYNKQLKKLLLRINDVELCFYRTLSTHNKIMIHLEYNDFKLTDDVYECSSNLLIKF